MTFSNDSPNNLTGLILAGGGGQRMSGADKGLLVWQGQPLAAWVLQRLRPQVGSVLIAANRNLADYQALGAPLVSDVWREADGGLAGPLAGIHAGLSAAQTPYLLTVPCDVPQLPLDLAARLWTALQANSADIAFAYGAGRVQPLLALYRCTVRDDLQAFLAGGERKVQVWQTRLPHVRVDFSDAAAFANFNTPDHLQRAASL